MSYKLALAYSTKDRVELTRQSFERVRRAHLLFMVDGSTDEDALTFAREAMTTHTFLGVRGGADAAIVFSLTRLLATDADYLGLVENDVMLDPDWLEPTMELFEKGKRDGLDPGAVTPRTYVDRILVQRDGYAVLHNAGAGVIVFTRAAAELVLRNFRTGWWPDNRKIFAQVSGLDIGTWGAFGFNEQPVTADWNFEATLARHGLAVLGLTPSKCQMIGQVPSLAEQGLVLAEGMVEERVDQKALERFWVNTQMLREGTLVAERPHALRRDGNSMLFMPHQMGMLLSRFEGDWRLQWCQGHGPFAYRAGAGGASLSVLVSGSCSYLLSGGTAGATVTVEDHRSSFKASPQLPPQGNEYIAVTVPGALVPRKVTLTCEAGAIFYGLSCVDSQMIDTSFKFDYSILPEV